MDIRYSTNPNDVKRYTTEDLRNEFLIQNLYKEDQVVSIYSHVDRMVVLGICPVHEQLPITKGIDVWKEFGTDYFLERREAVVIACEKGKIDIIAAAAPSPIDKPIGKPKLSVTTIIVTINKAANVTLVIISSLIKSILSFLYILHILRIYYIQRKTP